MYKINVFASLIGIPMRTIHTWERRYGLLRARRASSGHRMYYEEHVAEAEIIKDLQVSGTPISEIKHHPKYRGFKIGNKENKASPKVSVLDPEFMRKLDEIRMEIKALKSELRAELKKITSLEGAV